MPTRAAASAPNACESAVRCGIAVMGTQIAIQRADDGAEGESGDDPVVGDDVLCISVPMMAASMPASARNMPRRAVSGCDMPLSAKMKRMEASR